MIVITARESYSVLDFLTLSAAHEGLEMTVFAILLHLLRQTSRQADAEIPADRRGLGMREGMNTGKAFTDARFRDFEIVICLKIEPVLR
jgi:hypothetical protein